MSFKTPETAPPPLRSELLFQLGPDLVQEGLLLAEGRQKKRDFGCGLGALLDSEGFGGF